MRRLLLLLSNLLLAVQLSAANHYVLDGGSGDGSSWSSAWDVLPTTLVRGDTYYIGDGTYAAYDFDTAASGSTYVYIRKATTADHGTDTGWSSAYGDGQAVFTSTGGIWAFSTPYWDIDGQTGSLNGARGFQLVITGTATPVYAARCSAAGAGHLIFRDVEMSSTGDIGAMDPSAKQSGFYCTQSVTDVSFYDCYIHDLKWCAYVFSSMSNIIVSGGWVENTHSFSLAHGQAVQMGPGLVTDALFIGIMFKNTHGTGVLVALDNLGFARINVANCIHWSTAHAAYGLDGTSQFFGTTSGDTATDCHVFGCTFVGGNIYNATRATPDAIDFNESASNCTAYNNLWYDSNAGFTLVDHDYNWFYLSGTQSETHIQNGSGNPFTDLSGGDFTLTANTEAGTTLSSPYDVDITGAARTTWTRGAYEFGSSGGGGGDTTPPAISAVSPSPSTTSATVTWTTDEAATSGLEWGLTASYGSSSTNSAAVTSHSLDATGLSQATLYHYRVHSTDAAGNHAQSIDGTFTTAAAGEPVDQGHVSGGRIGGGRFR